MATVCKSQTLSKRVPWLMAGDRSVVGVSLRETAIGGQLAGPIQRSYSILSLAITR